MDSYVWPLKILVLHHQFQRRPEDTPFKLVDEMIDVMYLLGLGRNLSSVYFQLNLSDEHIAIDEIH